LKLKISSIAISVVDLLIALVELYFLILKFSKDAVVFYIMGSMCLLYALSGLIAPKFTYNACWKFCSKFSEFDSDYDSGYRCLPKVLFGLSITSLIFQIISLLFTII